MDRATKEAAMNIVKNDVQSFHKRYSEIMKIMEEQAQVAVEHFRSMVEQIPSTVSGPLIPKTPKVLRKKPVAKIDTIPENEIVNETVSKNEFSKAEESEDDIIPQRSRRAASQRASASIKKQQSITLLAKMRRPSANEENIQNQTTLNKRSRRQKNSVTSSDDEDVSRPLKISKIDKKETKKKGRQPKIKVELVSPEEQTEKPEIYEIVAPTPQQSQRNGSTKSLRSSSSGKSKGKKDIIDETMDIADAEITDDITITEPSMYEDAVGKSIPMSSTMNPDSTVTIDRKMMNVTVVLEKITDTTSLSQKNSIQSAYNSQRNSAKYSEQSHLSVQNGTFVVQPKTTVPSVKGKESLRSKLQVLKERQEEQNDLITDDESSPERNVDKTMKNQEKPSPRRRKKLTHISTSDEDEAVSSPSPVKNVKTKKYKESKFKPNALFSPYAKESVKKKVEAYEQAVQSPIQKAVEIDLPTRVTRTKTRAMAAAENVEETPRAETVAQKLARKSLAKAKKISLSRQKREQEESKENAILNSAAKPSRLQLLNDKTSQKQQLKTTPASKSRLQVPMSVNRLHHTPASQGMLPARAMTTSKVYNVASSTESLAHAKIGSKSGSTDSLVDKKKLLNEEDPRWKKEEALKAQTEEKRRKREEKELKNKLAREAKERLEHEKRIKMEREREEKARQALIMQERMREEAERKRQLQLQRAQEKEARKRLEEQEKQQRLQEQEETERQLAEQKRREQEAERRRAAEARVKQLAEAEAQRFKAQCIAKSKAFQQQKQQQSQQQQIQGPSTYTLDSEPDGDDDSDDESKPKYPIPHWAMRHVRKNQLDMQQHIPIEVVLTFFGSKKCTPDLSELFIGIKKDKLKRTSSANWKTPPRFSMMEE